VHHHFAGPAVAIYDWDCAGHGPAVEEWSDAHEIIVARRGVFTRQVAGASDLIDAGVAALAHPDEVYRIRHPVPGGDRCSVFRLAPDAAREVVGWFDPAAADREIPRFPSGRVPLDGPSYLLHRLAFRAAAGPVEVEEWALAFAHAVLARAHAQQGGGPRRRAPSPTARAIDCVARVRELVAGRYLEKLTLSEISRAVECSPFHLSRQFTAVTGLPIHRLILQLRLRHALELILETRAGLSEIAFASGFASHSHMTDAFRREFGAAPRLLRGARSPNGVARLQVR